MKIPLTGRYGEVRAHVLVDAADYERFGSERWHLTRDGYAARCRRLADGRTRTDLMHRLVLELPHGDIRCADHINRNRLDNRRVNLRIVTRAENAQNLGRPMRGATWDAQAGKWRARAVLGGRHLFLGHFATQEQAASVAAAFRSEHMPFSAEAVAA